MPPLDALRAHRPCRLVYPLDPSGDLQKTLCSSMALPWLATCSYYQDAEKVRQRYWKAKVQAKAEKKGI